VPWSRRTPVFASSFGSSQAESEVLRLRAHKHRPPLWMTVVPKMWPAAKTSEVCRGAWSFLPGHPKPQTAIIVLKSDFSCRGWLCGHFTITSHTTMR
jgi:hypothetical protein